MEEYRGAGQASRWQYGSHALHAGPLRLQIHNHDV